MRGFAVAVLVQVFQITLLQWGSFRMAYISSSRTRGSKSIRICSCPSCGHKVRFNAEHCGRCYEPTKPINRSRTWFLIFVAIIAAVVALVL